MIGVRGPAMLIVAYVVVVPLVAGIPRGRPVPLLRVSELVLLVVTAGVVGMLWRAWMDGRRVVVSIAKLDVAIGLLALAGSALPLLWMTARGTPVDQENLLSAFPLIKYALLYFVTRIAVERVADMHAVLRAVVFAGIVLSAIGLLQVLRVAPVLDVLSRWFVSTAEEARFVADRRGSTTLGSPIATGAYIVLAFGIAVTLATVRRSSGWLAASAVLLVGAVASGQFSSAIGLGVVAGTVALIHRRTMDVLRLLAVLAIPGALVLRPVLAARLADTQNVWGLPESWVIRWVNVTRLFLPELGDGGWMLGVRPDAVIVPPDTWRESVYLESGYLWLLWVGGVPLLLAAGWMLTVSWRTARAVRPSDPGGASVAPSTQIAVAVMAVLLLLDPHLTLRGGADVFYVLLAMTVSCTSPALRASERETESWLDVLRGPTNPAPMLARLQIAESGGELDRRVVALRSRRTGSSSAPAASGIAGDPAAGFTVMVNHGGDVIAATRLEVIRCHDGLHGRLATPLFAEDPAAEALAWRAVMLMAGSLRFRSLSTPETTIDDAGALRRLARAARDLERSRVPVTDARMSRLAEPTGPLPIRFDLTHSTPRWKRSFDVALALTGLLVLAPLFLSIAVAVRRSSTGPALFRQIRIGRGGLPFEMLKFRTMTTGSDDAAARAHNRLEILGQAPPSKSFNASRVTSIGAFLRRTSLDELPQLVNVLRGKMSIVGPRPSLIWEVELFESRLRRRLVALPGLTGLWQSQGREELSMHTMLELDLDYVATAGLRRDLRCVIDTVGSLRAKEGAT